MGKKNTIQSVIGLERSIPTTWRKELSIGDKWTDGYNSAIDTEVVVDVGAIKKLVNIEGLLFRKDFENEVAQAIAKAFYDHKILGVKDE